MLHYLSKALSKIIPKGSTTIRNILVVRMGTLENGILSSSYLTSLKRAKFLNQVSVLGTETCLSLLKQNKELDILTIENLPGKNLIQKISILSKEREFDLIFLAFPFKDHNLLSYLKMNFKCPIIGFQHEDALNEQSHQFFEQGKHEIEENLNAFNSSFRYPFNKFSTLIKTPKQKLPIELINEKYHLGISEAAISEFQLHWGLDNFYELLEMIKSKMPTLEVYVMDETKSSILQTLDYVHDCSAWNIFQKTKLVSQLDFFIGSHSAYVHLANNFNIPHIMIMGPTSEVKSKPYNPKVFSYIAKSTIECRPCHIFGKDIQCTQTKQFKCLKDIKPQMVFKAWVSSLKESEVVQTDHIDNQPLLAAQV